MQSTLNPKQTDDPHDVLVVAPSVSLVAPTDEELSRLAKLAHDSARQPSDPKTPAESSGIPAGPPVPPVDTTFRPAAVNGVQLPGQRRSMGRGAVRAFIALLLAACISVAVFAWQSYGDVAKQMIANWTPQFALTSSLPLTKPGLPAQPAPPAVQADAATAPVQPAALNQTAPAAVAPAAAALPPDSSQSLQSMARDLASVGQEIEQLKASINELKAGQQQLSRDVAKVSEAKASEAKASEAKTSEQNARPTRISAAPPRPAAARPRRPTPPPYYPPPQAAAAPVLPQAAAPYAPRQPEPQPQATAQPQADPELSSVPRPPMPVR